MPTDFAINNLLDKLAIDLGQGFTHSRAVGRNVKAANIIPPSTKGDIPQVEALTAAVVLLATVVDRRQTHAVEALRTAWRVPPVLQQPYSSEGNFHASGPLRDVNVLKDIFGLGRTIERLISDYADNPEAGSEIVCRVEVWQDETFAAVHYRDRTVFYALPDTNRNDSHVVNRAVIPWQALRELGRLVAKSRAQAAKLGVQIDTSMTSAALEPVADRPAALGRASPSRAAVCERGAGENETATALPGDAAVSCSQPVYKTPAPSDSADLTHTHEGENQRPSRGLAVHTPS